MPPAHHHLALATVGFCLSQFGEGLYWNLTPFTYHFLPPISSNHITAFGHISGPGRE